MRRLGGLWRRGAGTHHSRLQAPGVQGGEQALPHVVCECQLPHKQRSVLSAWCHPGRQRVLERALFSTGDLCCSVACVCLQSSAEVLPQRPLRRVDERPCRGGRAVPSSWRECPRRYPSCECFPCHGNVTTAAAHLPDLAADIVVFLGIGLPPLTKYQVWRNTVGLCCRKSSRAGLCFCLSL